MLYRLSLPLFLAGVSFAQIGYPGGGYPYPGRSPYPGGSPYPTGGGSPLPIPGRRGTQKPTNNPNQPLANFEGTLKRLDDKYVSVELGDNRVMDFRRTSKTRFLKDGEEVKSPKWPNGDAVAVEAFEEPGGYMTAVNVRWEKAVSGDTASTNRSPEKDKAAGTPDTWAKDDDPDRPRLKRNSPASAEDAPKPAAAPTAKAEEDTVSKPEATAEKAPAATRRDEDDPGRPVLRRGGAATQRASEPERPVETASAKAPSKPVMRDGDDNSVPVVRRGQGDDVIRKATDAALEFTETLPAYVTQEFITRYQSEGGKPPRWSALDVVNMNLVYENGREDYRDIKVNGKPKASLEETGGAWSTGEFGTVLIDLFSPATSADFVFSRDGRASGIPTKVYDFRVAKENSHWSIKMGSQSYDPAYKGSVWIDPKTGRVMRIEMQAVGFPTSFPADTTESAVDYQYIRLGDARQYLLPVHAETLSCQRGTSYCSKNEIDFRNYHKYTGESNITFEQPKDVKK
jgi:hypothetical protein